MPFPILGWVAITAATAVVGYVASRASESSSGSGGYGPSAADIEREAEIRRREARAAEKRREASKALDALLAKHGLHVVERRRLAMLDDCRQGQTDPAYFDVEYRESDAEKGAAEQLEGLRRAIEVRATALRELERIAEGH